MVTITKWTLIMSCVFMFSVAAQAQTQTTSSESRAQLAMQGRIDEINVVSGSGFPNNIVPLVTPGVRLLDRKLFVGAGLGFTSTSDSGSRGFTFSPLVSYDFLSSPLGALYGIGWIPLGTADDGSQDGFFFGFNGGAGVRGKVNENLAIGSEWGLAISVVDRPANDTSLGFFGTIVFEGAVDL